MIPQIIAEVGFNRQQDETGDDRRIVSLYASKEDIYLSFAIGKESEDIMTLVFPVKEFMGKIAQTLVEQEVEDVKNP